MSTPNWPTRHNMWEHDDDQCRLSSTFIETFTFTDWNIYICSSTCLQKHVRAILARQSGCWAETWHCIPSTLYISTSHLYIFTSYLYIFTSHHIHLQIHIPFIYPHIPPLSVEGWQPLLLRSDQVSHFAPAPQPSTATKCFKWIQILFNLWWFQS